MLETVDAGERPQWGDLWRRAEIGLLMRGLSVADLAFCREGTPRLWGVVLFCGTEPDTKTQQRGAYPALLRYS